MVLQVMHALFRNEPTAFQFLSGADIKDTEGGKSSQWPELQTVHMVVHSSWKEKWTGVLLYTDSWAVANYFTGRSMIRKLVRKAFEQRTW